MFDRRDDARDREGSRDDRARVYDVRDRDDLDPRDGLARHLDLPRGEERELVVDRDRMYELNGEDSGTLAAVGAFEWCPSTTWTPTATPSRTCATKCWSLASTSATTSVG